jgi:hypothetical protein
MSAAEECLINLDTLLMEVEDLILYELEQLKSRNSAEYCAKPTNPFNNDESNELGNEDLAANFIEQQHIIKDVTSSYTEDEITLKANLLSVQKLRKDVLKEQVLYDFNIFSM